MKRLASTASSFSEVSCLRVHTQEQETNKRPKDGDWIYTVVDDKLYLSREDYDGNRWNEASWSLIGPRKDAEKEYIEAFQTGSRALMYAQCEDDNETWLPLLEKAYAKAHGDYQAIDGGYTGYGDHGSLSMSADRQ